MRRFKLINAKGAEWDLTSTASFFQNVGGLGFAREIKTIRAGHDFIVTQDNAKQKSPNGEIVFKGYDTYREFAAFIAHTPLILGYMPENKWYYIKCKVGSLGKTEKDRTTRRLICPIDFIALSTWYSEHRAYPVSVNEAVGKRYPYTYPYTYVESAAGSVEVENTGILPAPCIIHIFGEAVKPSWALVHDGQIILQGKVGVTIPEGNKLVVNSMPSELEIAEYTVDNEYVQNLYQDSDFSTARFIMLPPGKSIVSFSHETTSALTATVEVRRIADTV